MISVARQCNKLETLEILCIESKSSKDVTDMGLLKAFIGGSTSFSQFMVFNIKILSQNVKKVREFTLGQLVSQREKINMYSQCNFRLWVGQDAFSNVPARVHNKC